jgi:pyrroline-5-carboxylate reductase
MTIGFLGTGAIAEAMIDGLCGAAGHDGPVLVTERSAARSSRLAGKYKNVDRGSSAQAIVDASDVVVISVLPAQVLELINNVTFHADHIVLSVAAGIRIDDLKKAARPASRLHRALPMPPIERGLGPLPICPPDRDLASVFDGTGTVIGVESEAQFDTIATGSALMASFFAMVAQMADWMTRRGVGEREAAAYATSMFHSLAALTCDADAAELQALPDECLTPGGINEQVLRQLQAAGWLDEIDGGLDAIAKRLAKSG